MSARTIVTGPWVNAVPRAYVCMYYILQHFEYDLSATEYSIGLKREKKFILIRI